MAGLDRPAFVFPGQGSQHAGMFAGDDVPPETLAAAAEVGAALDMDLPALAADEEALGRTTVAQPALLAAGVGTWRAWRAAGGAPAVALAGLVCAGRLELAAAARLVGARAAAMQDAVPAGEGRMDAVLGLAPEQVAAACPAAAEAWVANLNSPQQAVLAGRTAAVAAAAAACQEAGAKRVVTLPVSVPSHCPLMAPAQAPLRAALAAAPLAAGEVPVIHNAASAPAADPAEAAELLVAQLVRPVDWIACVRALLARAGCLVECGPKSVLTGLHRRIAPDAACHSIDGRAAIAALLAA